MNNKVFTIADYLLEKGEASKRPLTNKVLQKLLYYCQAWQLVIHGDTLFDDEIEAWVHGPAIPRVYRRYSKFGYMPITGSVANITLNVKDQSLVDEVWSLYGGFDGNYLEALTHREEPWQRARANLLPHEASNAVISTESMMKYYGRRLKEAESSSETN